MKSKSLTLSAFDIKSENKNKGGVRVRIGRLLVYAILIIYSLWLLMPFFVILVTSFTSNAEYAEATGYIWWPKNFSFEGYERLFSDDPYMIGGIPSLLRGFLNTMWITLLPLFSSLFMSLLVAYCYSKYN